MSTENRLRIAVFIDFDNIEIGVKSTLGASFDAGLVLEALKERGEVVSKTAYSDWQRAGGYSRALTQHAIRMVQRNLTPGGDKNGADINLALDALEMAFTHSHINAFVIVGGDSDFISLVEKLKQYDKKIFVVGGRQFTSQILQRNCHEFIAYENLVGATNVASAGGGTRRATGRDGRNGRAAAEIEQAIPLVSRALKVLSEREVSPQLGLLKSTLLQLDSTFSERTYGAGSFRDFAQKLERAGVLKVHQGKGGWIVAPADGAAVEPPAPAEPAGKSPAATAPPPEARTPAPVVPIGSAADGIREFRRVIESAPIRRWPLYLRNVKQVIRQVNPEFDERAYGFANLVDLLRAAHRDGVVRVDRDRQGVVRVFQGALPAASPMRVDELREEVPMTVVDTVDDVGDASAPAETPAVAIEAVEDVVVAVNPEETATAAPPARRRRSRPASPAARRPRARRAS